MVDHMCAGDFVQHKKFGRGKVVHCDGANARIYFKDKMGAKPEERTAVFRLPTDRLSICADQKDPVLDAIPPWKGDRFERFDTDLDIDSAKARFLRHFNKGFDDPEYVRRERGYKEAASRRYAGSFAPFAAEWVATRNAAAIVNALRTVYGNVRDGSVSPDERLNLLYPKVEEPAFFDALERAGDPLFSYTEGVLAFVESGTPGAFEQFVNGLMSLPTRREGASLSHWTTLTWLPFIARPRDHILVKPTITKTFASILPFEIRYRAELNFQTYGLSVSLAKALGAHLQNSELNLSARVLDMIDVQSFMWVVMRYAQPALYDAVD